MAKAQKEIPEDKIRIVKWMLKTGKTKKACCEELGIAYNTKRLAKIISDFDDEQERAKKLKASKSKAPLSKADINFIISSYQEGKSRKYIYETLHITDTRVKKVLLENNIPIRGHKGRGKNKPATITHVSQNLDTRFKKGDKVFVGPHSCYGIIDQVRDEEFLDYLHSGIQKYVELHNPSRAEKLKKGLIYDDGGRRGIDYEIYWVLEDGKEYKLEALQHLIKQIESELVDNGMEYYRVWVEIEGKGKSTDSSKFFGHFPRQNLFPIVKQAA